jgi:uncharacterized membrane protein
MNTKLRAGLEVAAGVTAVTAGSVAVALGLHVYGAETIIQIISAAVIVYVIREIYLIRIDQLTRTKKIRESLDRMDKTCDRVIERHSR